MHSFAAAGAAFLICVLWFDLMFDTQVRGHDGAAVPEAALASISGYYRGIGRAWPMNRLVAVVMLGTVLVIVLEIIFGAYHRWLEWISLLAAVSAIGLARVRIVRIESITSGQHRRFRNPRCSSAIQITLLNVKPAVGFTLPSAGVTPAPGIPEMKMRD